MITTSRILLVAGILVPACCGSARAATPYNIADRGLLVEEKIGGLPGGVKVTRALTDAAVAGLKSGDVITHVDGVFVTNLASFITLMTGKSSSESIALRLSDGTTKTLYKPVFGGAWQSNLGRIDFTETRKLDGSVDVKGELTPYGGGAKIPFYINGQRFVDNALRGTFNNGKRVELVFRDPTNKNVLSNDTAAITAAYGELSPQELILFRIN